MHYRYHNIYVNIIIGGKVEFPVCNQIKIVRSIKDLTSTATLILPREMRNAVDKFGKSVNLSGRSILDFITRGDTVDISFGYDGDVENEFSGYVSSISADIPLVIECEDEMLQLKKGDRISTYIQSGDLKDILEAIVPSRYNIELNEKYNVGSWLIEDANAYDVLKELKDKVGLHFYFKDKNTLKAGMPVDFRPTNTYAFNFSENIRKGSSLIFRRKDDRKLQVTVKSKQADGQEYKYVLGESGGDTKLISFPRLTKEECKSWAEKELAKQYFEGFEGSFDSWCYPRTRPGDSVRLIRPFYEDRHQDGHYFIEAVTTLISLGSGIKRTNQISYKL